jgi:hypothetical protein
VWGGILRFCWSFIPFPYIYIPEAAPITEKSSCVKIREGRFRWSSKQILLWP